MAVDEIEVRIGLRFVWLIVLLNIPATLFGMKAFVPGFCVIVTPNKIRTVKDTTSK